MENLVRKVEIACNKQFLLFSQCFLPNMVLIFHFKCTLNWRLQTVSMWNGLKFCRLVMGLSHYHHYYSYLAANHHGSQIKRLTNCNVHPTYLVCTSGHFCKLFLHLSPFLDCCKCLLNFPMLKHKRKVSYKGKAVHQPITVEIFFHKKKKKSLPNHIRAKIAGSNSNHHMQLLPFSFSPLVCK